MARKISLEKEREYENSLMLSDGLARRSQEKYYWATAPYIDDFNEKTSRAIVGKKVLEIGCSDGYYANLYCKTAKFVTGIDLSDEGIRLANERNLTNADFYVVDAHKLPFEDSSYDIVIVNSLLHHLDLSIALKEIDRVLTTNGILLAREPLGTNPLFSLYRLLTPKARTSDERPFTFSDLKLLEKYFELKSVEYFGFLSVFSAFLKLDIVRNVLTKIDFVLSYTPVKYLFWQFAGEFKKKN
ncbi:class I SAM-dependent methyltransferase [Gammaproteobacteria bacterium]|nr:class I SAM-dependent methyltransferase [Gammaproteobacteria bacterium]